MSRFNPYNNYAVRVREKIASFLHMRCLLLPLSDSVVFHNTLTGR